MTFHILYVQLFMTLLTKTSGQQLVGPPVASIDSLRLSMPSLAELMLVCCLPCPQKLMQFFNETSLSPGDAIQVCAMVSVELAGGPKFEDFGFESAQVTHDVLWAITRVFKTTGTGLA